MRSLDLEYSDFNQAYYELNRMILLNPHLVQYLNTTMGSIDGIEIECKTSKCDEIDLGALGYKQGKWNHLVNTYLGKDKIYELRSLGTQTKGLSVGFDFKRKSTGNGSCMREIILSRTKRGKPWETITVIWRSTELQRRWAADLILLARIIELIPNSKFTKIKLYLTTCYQSAMYIIPLVEPIFGLKIADLDPNHFYTKVIITREAKYYKPESSPHTLLASGDRIVDLYKQYERGEKLPSIMYKDCTLGGNSK